MKYTIEEYLPTRFTIEQLFLNSVEYAYLKVNQEEMQKFVSKKIKVERYYRICLFPDVKTGYEGVIYQLKSFLENKGFECYTTTVIYDVGFNYDNKEKAKQFDEEFKKAISEDTTYEKLLLDRLPKNIQFKIKSNEFDEEVIKFFKNYKPPRKKGSDIGIIFFRGTEDFMDFVCGLVRGNKEDEQ